MSRLDRFLRLEKERPSGSKPAAALGSPGRFSAEPPPEDRPLRVLEDGGMPFVRCCVCRTDQHLTATVCQNCESDLSTPVQRAFNQALAHDYEARAAEERGDAERVHAARAEADREGREAQRKAIDMLMRAEARRAGLPSAADEVPSIGLRLARRVTNPVLRLLVLVAAGVLPLVLVFGSRIGSTRFEVGLLLVFVVAAAFAPRRLRRAIWED